MDGFLKMNKKGERDVGVTVFAILIGLSLIGLGIFIIYGGLTLEEGEEKVKCFDRFSNEIIGVECITETTISDQVMLGLVGVVFIVIGVLFMGILSNLAATLWDEI